LALSNSLAKARPNSDLMIPTKIIKSMKIAKLSSIILVDYLGWVQCRLGSQLILETLLSQGSVEEGESTEQSCSGHQKCFGVYVTWRPPICIDFVSKLAKGARRFD
jgi:hypothetical protein